MSIQMIKFMLLFLGILIAFSLHLNWAYRALQFVTKLPLSSEFSSRGERRQSLVQYLLAYIAVSITASLLYLFYLGPYLVY